MKNLLIAVAALAMATPAFAQNTVTAWSGTNYDVFGSSPGEIAQCVMTSTFEVTGRASVKFDLIVNAERVMLGLASYDWSVVDSQRYEGFVYQFEPSRMTYGNLMTFGVVDPAVGRGFVSGFDGDFLDRVASESRLLVFRDRPGEEPVIVADLNLVGSAPAVAALRRCFDHVQRREAASMERERANDYIARDPFAD